MQPGQPKGNGKYAHGKTGLRRILHTVIHSRDGFVATFKGEAAFRQLLLLHGALIASLWNTIHFPRTPRTWAVPHRALPC
ncbi:hypothetical protein [Stenotrophomonas indicatrix]|uniref:hypothetical protein n=1 Tax=Stenotrophomonas indicatrix TaxID=2045451 RepID=UPI003D0EA85C